MDKYFRFDDLKDIFIRFLISPPIPLSHVGWIRNSETRCMSFIIPRHHFADGMAKLIFLSINSCISTHISLNFFPKGPRNNKPLLVQMKTLRRIGDNTLSEPHEDVIKWKYFPRYWPIVWGIHRWPDIGQWHGALMFFICALNQRLSKQSWGWWFETPSRPLWRHSNGWWHYWCLYTSFGFGGLIVEVLTFYSVISYKK